MVIVKSTNDSGGKAIEPFDGSATEGTDISKGGPREGPNDYRTATLVGARVARSGGETELSHVSLTNKSHFDPHTDHNNTGGKVNASDSWRQDKNPCPW